MDVDLSKHGVYRHFSGDPLFMQFLSRLDHTDRWAIDQQFGISQEEISLFIRKLKGFLETEVDNSHFVVEDILEISCYLSTTRALYIFDYLAQNNPVFKEKLEVLLAKCEQTIPVLIAKKRKEVVERGQNFTQIFSKERLEIIAEIMRSYHV